MFQIINICRLYQRHLVCHRNLGYHQAQWWFCPLLDGLWQQHLLPLHPHPPRHPPQHILSWQCHQSTQVLCHYHLVIWYLLNLLIPTLNVWRIVTIFIFQIFIFIIIPVLLVIFLDTSKNQNVPGPNLSLRETSVGSTRTRQWSRPER